jgi:hypothetical protein
VPFLSGEFRPFLTSLSGIRDRDILNDFIKGNPPLDLLLGVTILKHSNFYVKLVPLFIFWINSDLVDSPATIATGTQQPS